MGQKGGFTSLKKGPFWTPFDGIGPKWTTSVTKLCVVTDAIDHLEGLRPPLEPVVFHFGDQYYHVCAHEWSCAVGRLRNDNIGRPIGELLGFCGPGWDTFSPDRPQSKPGTKTGPKSRETVVDHSRTGASGVRWPRPWAGSTPAKCGIGLLLSVFHLSVAFVDPIWPVWDRFASNGLKPKGLHVSA